MEGSGAVGPAVSPLGATAPAPLSRRLAALSIDWFASLLVTRIVVPGVEYGSSDYGLVALAVFAAESAVLTWLAGASFGQRLMLLRVLAEGGRRLSLARAVARTALLCLVIPAVVWDSQGRGLHDRLAGTRIVRVLERATGSTPTRPRGNR